MRIDYEDILAHAEERAEFNRPALTEIEFYKDGKRVDIPESVLSEFKFTGLNNIDFFTSDFFDWPE